MFDVMPRVPKLRHAATSALEVAADILVLPFVDGPEAPDATAEVLHALGTDLHHVLSLLDVEPRPGALGVLPTLGRLSCAGVVLVYVELHGDVTAVREAALAAGVRCVGHRLIATTLTELLDAGAEAMECVAEGLALGLRRGARGREAATTGVTLLDRRPLPGGVAGAALRAAASTVRATGWAQALVDAPADAAFPAAIASAVRRVAEPAGLFCRTLEFDALTRERFGGLLRVGAGSAHAPCLVELRTQPAQPAGRPVVLVGKGVTFDAGGLELKPFAQMANEKQDMAGAAAVAAAALGAAELELETEVVALLALAENMPDGAALRPGDVVRQRDGSTTEVTSTDAEGRLLLADVLHYAVEQRPAAIVDVATLTGGGGLGPDLWAVIGNDAALTRALLVAGERSGDRGWELPLWRPYLRFLGSTAADRSNHPGSFRYPFDAIAAGAFLGEFARGVPWAHLDISSAAGRDARTASGSWPVGATGSPTRALLAWLRGRVEPAPQRES